MVILVDKQDRELGTMEKLKAHELGLLHRAFSVFLFNSKGEMLLQKRAKEKYHSGGLWTNSCCSHQLPNESSEKAGIRRLKEEIGIEISKLETKGHLLYKTEFENGLAEHEYDHILFGFTDEEPILNPEEAESFRYISISDLLIEIKEKPEVFTFWFKEIIKKYPEIF